MKLSKVEVYVWGFNDEKEVDGVEALEDLKNESRRDIELVIGNVESVDLPDPDGDDYPLNFRDRALSFCRYMFPQEPE
jgi:hypothetical protein